MHRVKGCSIIYDFEYDEKYKALAKVRQGG